MQKRSVDLQGESLQFHRTVAGCHRMRWHVAAAHHTVSAGAAKIATFREVASSKTMWNGVPGLTNATCTMQKAEINASGAQCQTGLMLTLTNSDPKSMPMTAADAQASSPKSTTPFMSSLSNQDLKPLKTRTPVFLGLLLLQHLGPYSVHPTPLQT